MLDVYKKRSPGRMPAGLHLMVCSLSVMLRLGGVLDLYGTRRYLKVFASAPDLYKEPVCPRGRRADRIFGYITVFFDQALSVVAVFRHTVSTQRVQNSDIKAFEGVSFAKPDFLPLSIQGQEECVVSLSTAQTSQGV